VAAFRARAVIGPSMVDLGMDDIDDQTAGAIKAAIRDA